MRYDPISLSQIIYGVNDWLFQSCLQRSSLWSEKQMRMFFDSLMRGLPVGPFLFLPTKDEAACLRFRQFVDWEERQYESLFDFSRSQAGVEKKLVLDGKQRIQSLYAIFRGGVKHRDGEIAEAYWDICSGVTADADDLYFQMVFSSEKMELPYFRLKDAANIGNNVNSEDMADEFNGKLDLLFGHESVTEREHRRRRVRRNCAQLFAVLRQSERLWYWDLDHSSTTSSDIYDIYLRLNNGGTRLSVVDLASASMNSVWPMARECIETTIGILNESGLGFGEKFVTKSMLVAHGYDPSLNADVHSCPLRAEMLDSIKKSWPEMQRAFLELGDFASTELLGWDEGLSDTQNWLIPVFDYLFNNPRPTEVDRVMMRAYCYKSRLFGWFAKRQDRTISDLHSVLGRRLSRFPIEQIKAYFGQEVSLDVVLAEDYHISPCFRRTLLWLVHKQRFGGNPFNVRLNTNRLCLDHIYPTSLLWGRLKLKGELANNIGNCRLTRTGDNARKGCELPSEYFSRLKEDGVDILNDLLVKEYADDPAKLAFDELSYANFCNKRSREILVIVKNVVDPELRTNQTLMT